MNYIPEDVIVTFQDVPNEISITFSITGCGKRCLGCHSPWLQDKNNGEELTKQKFMNHLSKNKGFISNVIFYGGEWEEEYLVDLLNISKEFQLNTTLFTSDEDVSENIKRYLNYLKTGPYIERLGALGSLTTNQKIVNVQTGENLNHLYEKLLDKEKTID